MIAPTTSEKMQKTMASSIEKKDVGTSSRNDFRQFYQRHDKRSRIPLNIPSSPFTDVEITEPNKNDVLCSRISYGNRIHMHEGNVQYRYLIHSKKEEYLSPNNSRSDKRRIAVGIVDHIYHSMDPPGRFLAKSKSSPTKDGKVVWHDIGYSKAIKKTTSALFDTRSPRITTYVTTAKKKNAANLSDSDDNNKGEQRKQEQVQQTQPQPQPQLIELSHFPKEVDIARTLLSL